MYLMTNVVPNKLAALDPMLPFAGMIPYIHSSNTQAGDEYSWMSWILNLYP